MDIAAGKYESEFLAAYSGHAAVFAQTGGKQPGYTLQGQIALLRAVDLIVLPEIIKVEQAERESGILAFFEFRV